jgi:hypothetical protein
MEVSDADRELFEDIKAWLKDGHHEGVCPGMIAEFRQKAISTQAAELDALREDVERSEKHRNDLADRNTSLSIENGALKATIAQLRDRVAKFAEILETVLPYTEAERLREEADVRCGRTYRNPIQKAVNKARALLTQNEVG